MRLAGILISEDTIRKIANEKELEKALEKRGTRNLTRTEQLDRLLVDFALSRNNSLGKTISKNSELILTKGS